MQYVDGFKYESGKSGTHCRRVSQLNQTEELMVTEIDNEIKYTYL
jgi:hypothetical protein